MQILKHILLIFFVRMKTISKTDQYDNSTTAGFLLNLMQNQLIHCLHPRHSKAVMSQFRSGNRHEDMLLY